MRKRFIVKSVTKFVVFDNQTRSIVKGEYLSIQNADAQARIMNLDARSIEVFAKAEATHAAVNCSGRADE
jgi:hypothetical protein